MKNNYDKYIQEVWEMKDKAYNDFKKSGYSNYVDYINNELKSLKVAYRKKNVSEIKN